jgi:hypothetical protein
VPDEPFAPTTGQYETDKMVRDWLRKPFRREQIGRLPATGKRPALDFVGHAAVTDRLNKIAPGWSYSIDERWDGLSVEYVKGNEVQVPTFWVRGTMTIGGVSRAEVGDGKDAKEAIGNFIRRGAMRFGVAIDLWSREELESAPAMEASADAGGRVDQASSASRASFVPAGSSAGVVDPEPAGAGTASSEGTAESYGEGGSEPSATPAPGGGSSPFSPPPGTGTVDPLTCGHKYGTGAPAKVKIGGKELCRLCGTPWVTVVEGTTADLGAA